MIETTPAKRKGTFSKESGFTFIELAVVIVVVIILAVAAISAGIRELQVSKLREANSQLLADIEELRSASVRTSRSTALELINPTSGSENDGERANSYKMIFDKNDPSKSIVRTLPTGVEIAMNSGSGTKQGISKFGYTAPYGTITAIGIEATMRTQYGGSDWYDSRANRYHILNYLIGVTGKPVTGNLERTRQ